LESNRPQSDARAWSRGVGRGWGEKTVIKLQATIACPACGHRAPETMPTDACIYLYTCKKCGLEMKPRKGDCCVFCCYADVPCPPVQKEREA
jgi:hypothetical protein